MRDADGHQHDLVFEAVNILCRDGFVPRHDGRFMDAWGKEGADGSEEKHRPNANVLSRHQECCGKHKTKYKHSNE